MVGEYSIRQVRDDTEIVLRPAPTRNKRSIHIHRDEIVALATDNVRTDLIWLQAEGADVVDL